MQQAFPITGVNEYDLNTLAGRLAWARDRLEISQDELAQRAGVSQGTIGNIESGIRKNPRELLAIAAAAGVQPLWLKSKKGPITARVGWPLSDELLSALEHSDIATRLLVENQSRLAVGLPTLSTADSLVSGMDAAATVDASRQQNAVVVVTKPSPLLGMELDADQDLTESLRQLARQLQTMTPTQRQAMVAKLRTLGETSGWDTTHRRKTPEQLGEQTIDQDEPRQKAARRAKQ